MYQNMRKMRSMTIDPGQGPLSESQTPEAPGAPVEDDQALGAEAAEATIDPTAGLKRKNAELLGKLKDATDWKRAQEQAGLEATGQHETVISQLREDNAALQTKADRWEAYEASQSLEIEREIKKLPKADQDFVNGETDITRRRALLARFQKQSAIAAPSIDAPSVTPPSPGDATKPLHAMSAEERAKARNSKNGSTWGGILG